MNTKPEKEKSSAKKENLTSKPEGMTKPFKPEYKLPEDFKTYSGLCLKGGLVLDGENMGAIAEIVSLFEKNERGIMILGNPGSGKTFALDCLQRILHPQDKRLFSSINAIDLVTEFNQHGHEVFNRHNTKNMLFDDLGTERKGRYFGESIEVFENLIQLRYNLFRNHGRITHFTSNLKLKEIYARYGLRCKSRLQEMSDFVELGGDENSADRRKLRNFQGYPRVIHRKIPTEEDLAWKKQYAEFKKRSQELVPNNENFGLGTKLRKAMGL